MCGPKCDPLEGLDDGGTEDSRAVPCRDLENSMTQHDRHSRTADQRRTGSAGVWAGRIVGQRCHVRHRARAVANLFLGTLAGLLLVGLGPAGCSPRAATTTPPARHAEPTHDPNTRVRRLADQDAERLRAELAEKQQQRAEQERRRDQRTARPGRSRTNSASSCFR